MRRHLALLAVAAGALAIGGSVPAQPTGQAPALIWVDVPGDDQVRFFDHLTRQGGTRRLYRSPALASGPDYYYDVKATVSRQGKLIADTRTLSVQPGQTYRVAFGELTAYRRQIEIGIDPLRDVSGSLMDDTVVTAPEIGGREDPLLPDVNVYGDGPKGFADSHGLHHVRLVFEGPRPGADANAVVVARRARAAR